MYRLDTSVGQVPKISRRVLPALKRLGIATIRDLLFYFPARYEDFSNTKKISDAELSETVTIQGEIKKLTNRRTARKHMILTEAVIGDESGAMKALWFNQPFLLRNLRQGQVVSLSGKVARGPNGLYLQNPAHEKVATRALHTNTSVHTGGLVAIYPETKGMTSRWLRFLIKSFIELRKELTDPLPQETRKKYNLPEIQTAIRATHFPRTKGEAAEAKNRFQFEELLFLQLRALRERILLKKEKAPAVPLNLPLIKQFVASLPFLLTDAQRRALWEILQDIAKTSPMNRLLEGDVGSGKTVVAAGAALAVVKSGFRVAYMAPTEILARQHFETFSRLLSPFNIAIGLLTGSEKKSPSADILIGTHALIQKKARIENIGLVIIDEQHRFGVEQRAMLLRNQESGIRNRGQEKEQLRPPIHNSSFLIPHFLSMSATPIPRTLALSIYGDLDLSLLDETPKARKPTVTKIVEPSERDKAYQFIRDEVKRGRQVFVICPRIEVPDQKSKIQSNTPQRNLLFAEAKAVKEEYKKLSETIFPDFSVGMLHGKMKSKEKSETMKQFRDGKTHILVSTSVVEVGVDVPNASVMMIEGAERFGLSQLHQFRGRVGRGAEQSYCFLFPTEDGTTTRRLRAVAEAKNGFELAEKDLAIRGPGNLFGIKQSGTPTMIFAALTNTKLVRDVRLEAMRLLAQSPDLLDYPLLRKRLGQMADEVHFE